MFPTDNTLTPEEEFILDFAKEHYTLNFILTEPPNSFMTFNNWVAFIVKQQNIFNLRLDVLQRCNQA